MTSLNGPPNARHLAADLTYLKRLFLVDRTELQHRASGLDARGHEPFLLIVRAWSDDRPLLVARLVHAEHDQMWL